MQSLLGHCAKLEEPAKLSNFLMSRLVICSHLGAVPLLETGAIDPQLQRDLRIIVEVTSRYPQPLSTSVNFWRIVSHELGPENVVRNSKTFGGVLADNKPSTLEYHLRHSQLQYSSNYDLSARVLQ